MGRIRTEDQEHLLRQLKKLDWLEVYIYTGPVNRPAIRNLIFQWVNRRHLVGCFRTFQHNNKLYIIRVETLDYQAEIPEPSTET